MQCEKMLKKLEIIEKIVKIWHFHKIAKNNLMKP